MALGDADIIGAMTTTLENLLKAAGLAPTLDSPADVTVAAADTLDINLFLYQVLENPHAKNQPWVTGIDGKQCYPPLALNLFYLLTPFARLPVTAHQVLGTAMQAFHTNSLLRGDELEEAVRLRIDQLAIVLCPMKLEELTRVWNALQKPYRLSVCYEVRIVLVDSGVERAPSRVVTKIDRYSQL